MNVLIRVVAALAVLFCSLEVRSEEYPKQLLQKTFNEVKADNPFKCGTDWVRYPAYEDRQAWEELLGSHAGRLIKEGEKYLNFEWHMIKATQYLAFERTGERQIMEVPFHENRVALNALMLAELAEGKGRFVFQGAFERKIRLAKQESIFIRGQAHGSEKRTTAYQKLCKA